MSAINKYMANPKEPLKPLGHFMTFGDLSTRTMEVIEDNPDYDNEAFLKAVMGKFGDWDGLLEEINGHICNLCGSFDFNWDSMDYHINEILEGVVVE